jgi:hypothetical protein
MYRAAVQNSLSNGGSTEATALCNYATFLFKYKKDIESSKTLFVLGLKK